MPLHVKDPKADRLAKPHAPLRRLSKTEALHREFDRVEPRSSLVERGVAFAAALRAKGDPTRAEPADRAFIDGLYEKP